MRLVTWLTLCILTLIVFDSYVLSWYGPTGIFRKNRHYVFDFMEQTKTDNYFTERFSYIVNFEMKSSNYGKLWLSLRYAGISYDASFDSSKFQPVDTFQKNDLEKNVRNHLTLPLHFEATNGIITNVFFHPNDSNFSKNKKRKILSLINLKRFPFSIDGSVDDADDLQRYEIDFMNSEVSIYGNCSSHYHGVVPSQDEDFKIHKNVDHEKCEDSTLPLDYLLTDFVYPFRLGPNNCQNLTTSCVYHLTGTFNAYGVRKIECKSETICLFGSNVSIYTTDLTKLIFHHYLFQTYEDDDIEFTLGSLLHQPNENYNGIWVNMINGVPVKKGYHHTCQLVGPKKKHLCTCSIVGDSIVLLSAHCILDVPVDDFFIYAGSYKSVDPSALRYPVKRAQRMTNFTGEWKEGRDVGVINIQGKFDFTNPMIKKIRVIHGQTSNYFENYKTAGFGRTETGQLSSVLLKAKFNQVKKEDCQKQQKFQLVDQLCFKSRTQAIGKGDSGSGIFHRKNYDLLLAITSGSLFVPNEMFWASDLADPNIQQFLESEHVFDDEIYSEEL